MNFISNGSSFRRFAASTTATLCTGPAILKGIFVAGVTTAQFVQVWDGNDATLASPGTIVVGTCSLATSNYYEMPANCLSGITIQVLNDDVDLTVFYVPAGNNT